MLKIKRGCTPATQKCPYHTWNMGEKPRARKGEKIKENARMRDMPPCCIKHLREIIWYLTDLLEKEQIPYWADFGTLLGAVREGRTISHDTDGDLCAFLVDRPRIMDLKAKINRDGFAMGIRKPARSNDNHVKICRSTKNHMTVDIFFWEHDESKRIFKSPGLNAPKSFPDWWVEELTRVEIFGKPVWAPRDPEHFLEMRFGKSWKKPYDEKVHHGEAVKTHLYGFIYAGERGWKKKVKLT